ncbi:macro domain-containing protein [Muricoccus radiodurans]|uniref:macro domain-containing protein n=1 Tax=Muricoccus radiodurans TaxID=2231721 RepID=UPI003CE7CA94
MPMRVAVVDITTLDVDAIVNAANERLAAGGGVCGAIHRAAGPGLEAACLAIEDRPVPVGEARLTPGFGLRARSVIHAVGPVWYGGDRGEAERLAACYTSSLALLRGAGGRSIAFPAISTGIFGYPPPRAVDVAIGAVRADLAAHGDVEVVFACFDEWNAELYAERLTSPS